MGRAKQLLPFRGTTLLRHAATLAATTGFSPVIVVLGAEAEACGREVADLAVTVVVHAEWKLGIGSSLRIGVETLEKISPGAEAVLIMLHDQPLISSAVLQKLGELRRPPQWMIAAAFYGGTPGVPAVFDRALFGELKALPASEGAKKILLRHMEKVARLEMPEALEDIDSAEDYGRISRK